MTEPMPKNISLYDSDEIDLLEFFSAIRAGKWIIIATTILFSVTAVFYSLSLPNIYKSEVTLVPAGESGGLNIQGQLGGLAALAGVNLGGQGADKTVLALEILKSRLFLGHFIEENDLYVPIMAAKGWDEASGKLLINDNVYDQVNKQWLRADANLLKQKPSILETIEVLKNLITVTQDKNTGVIKISAEHYSPNFAKELVEKLVYALNTKLRERDLQDAEKSIEYLNNKIKLTKLSDIQVMLFSLIEEQTKKVMLANVRQEYLFETIDPAIVSEEKFKPSRAVICIVFTISGFVASCIFVLICHFRAK